MQSFSIAPGSGNQTPDNNATIDKSNLMTESLLQSLSILERCLCFDFAGILLNETMVEPVNINLPKSWAPFIENPKTIQNLFRVLMADIRNQQSTAIKVKALQAL